MYSPNQNAMVMPQQQQSPQTTSGNALAGMLGGGLAQGAADLKRDYPIWQQEYMDGTTTLQFPEWLKSRGQQNPAMPAEPKSQNSLGSILSGYV